MNKLVSAKYYLEEKDDNIIPYELDWWKFDLIVVNENYRIFQNSKIYFRKSLLDVIRTEDRALKKEEVNLIAKHIKSRISLRASLAFSPCYVPNNVESKGHIFTLEVSPFKALWFEALTQK